MEPRNPTADFTLGNRHLKVGFSKTTSRSQIVYICVCACTCMFRYFQNQALNSPGNAPFVLCQAGGYDMLLADFITFKQVTFANRAMALLLCVCVCVSLLSFLVGKLVCCFPSVVFFSYICLQFCLPKWFYSLSQIHQFPNDHFTSWLTYNHFSFNFTV